MTTEHKTPLNIIVESFARGKRGRVCMMFSEDTCGVELGLDDGLDLGLRIIDRAGKAKHMIESSPGLVLPQRY